MIEHTIFSRHAYERVLERCSMEPYEIADLLDWNLALTIGEEKGTRRIHRLFYSHDDYQCFVAIQDDKTKTVVTLLPVDYYETLVAKVSQTCLDGAKRLVSDKPEVERTPAVVAEDVSTGDETEEVPNSFKVAGTFMNLQRKPRTVNLGSWPTAPYVGSFAKLLQDAEFFVQMQIKLTARIQPEEYLTGLLIRLGKKGKPVWVDINDDCLGEITPLLPR